MRSHDGILWVADIDSVISIKIATGTIFKKARVCPALGLAGWPRQHGFSFGG